MTYKTKLLNFYDLPENRQEEILSDADWAENPEEHCSQMMYWHHPEIDPSDLTKIVWSTEKVMRIDDPYWHGALTVSNTMGLLVRIENDEIEVKHV